MPPNSVYRVAPTIGDGRGWSGAQTAAQCGAADRENGITDCGRVFAAFRSEPTKARQFANARRRDVQGDSHRACALPFSMTPHARGAGRLRGHDAGTVSATPGGIKSSAVFGPIERVWTNGQAGQSRDIVLFVRTSHRVGQPDRTDRGLYRAPCLSGFRARPVRMIMHLAVLRIRRPRNGFDAIPQLDDL
jgi:hypothetical protein